MHHSLNGTALTFDLKSQKSRIYIKTRNSMVLGFVIFVFGLFLVTPVA
ncbi:uncharacterized protein METZ01_LOCUS276581, partial [marine metagenome]